MMAVREVSTMRQVETEDGVTRLQHCRVSRHVGLRSGMRLHVGVLRADELGCGWSSALALHYCLQNDESFSPGGNKSLPHFRLTRPFVNLRIANTFRATSAS